MRLFTNLFALGFGLLLAGVSGLLAGYLFLCVWLVCDALFEALENIG